MNESSHIRIVIPEPVVMQPRLMVKVLPLKANGLICRLAPNVAIVRCKLAWGLLGLNLLPRLHVAGVVCHPLRDGV